MKPKTQQAAVIGAGVMGAAIAAHLANAGIPTILLDIVPPKFTPEDEAKGLTPDAPAFRNRLADSGLAHALKANPAAFYVPENAKLITTGNLEDHLGLLGNADWIIEAVVERLDIKNALFEKVETVRTPGTIVSTNTSGIPVADMCEGRSEDFRKHFVGTHFFNPPRYMKLLEIISGPDTLPEVVEAVARVGEEQLGKGIVYAKDTPNFVANRIGMYSMMRAIRVMQELGLTVEAVDKITGPAIGNPKSASFRTADLVGLDTMAHVSANVYDSATHDECRSEFEVPDVLKTMIERSFLGDKTGGGFYKKSVDEKGKKQILSMDLNSFEYTPQEKVRFASLEAIKTLEETPDKIRGLYYAKDKAGQFTFKTTSESLIYTANRIPEIADDIVNIDNAMRWGFARELGPFEVWDELGVKKSSAKMKEAGYVIPSWVQEMLDAGLEAFYKSENGTRYFYDVASKTYKELEIVPQIVLLPSLKDRNKTVAGNKGATLIDLGDGVACLEFHTKMNALGTDIISMMLKSSDIVSRDFEGLVLGNHGVNFSAGANLYMILFASQEEEWDDLHWEVAQLQKAFMKLKYLDKPVVAAPAGMALGGGCEVCLAADRVRAAAETYIGLVEVGVGLLPAGGGCKEMIIRNTEHLFDVPKGGVYNRQIDLLPFVARAFETIAMAKVATSGPEAQKMGLFRSTDKITINRDYLIHDAKQTVLAMNAEGYRPPRPKDDIRVMGTDGIAIFDYVVYTMHKGGYITDHDVTVAKKVGRVLCGGEVLPDTRVSEQYLLDLEREAFVSLCGDRKTQARIQHMLTTGKPLRN